MTILFIFSGCFVATLFVISCLSLQNDHGGARMINAEWMEPAEKFHFIARWGARN